MEKIVLTPDEIDAFLVSLTKFWKEELALNDATIAYMSEQLRALYTHGIGYVVFMGVGAEEYTVYFYSCTPNTRGALPFPQVCSVFSMFDFDPDATARWNFAALCPGMHTDGFYWGSRLIAPLPSDEIINRLLTVEFKGETITKEQIFEVIAWVYLTGAVPTESMERRIWKAYRRHEQDE